MMQYRSNEFWTKKTPLNAVSFYEFILKVHILLVHLLFLYFYNIVIRNCAQFRVFTDGRIWTHRTQNAMG